MQPEDNDNNYVDDPMDDKVGDPQLNREADTHTPGWS